MFWWILTLVLMLAGLIGTVVPLLPGTTIIFAAAVLHHYMLGEAQSVSWWTLSALLVLTVISHLLDLVSGSLGAKKFGATSMGSQWAVIVGAIVGLFFAGLSAFSSGH